MSYRVYRSDYQPGPKEEIYLPDPALAHAVNIAILLGQPLLITGEPGTGKTRLAYSIANQLKLGEPLRFNTKSTSASQELFYHYDALAHYRATQTGANPDVKAFLRAEALGAAILRTLPSEPRRDALLGNLAAPAPVRSVVLIDEIDKAPRDFPNDILSEIELLRFRVPELDGASFAISEEKALRPIVLITSNSEKHLPEAFLRRCVFAHIPFPDEDRLRTIVANHHPVLKNSGLVEEALDLFSALRHGGARRMDKLPATAELIRWVELLAVMLDGGSLKEKPDSIKESLGVLFKSGGDVEEAARIVDGWAS
jgi:MoxR-like ATPase